MTIPQFLFTHSTGNRHLLDFNFCAIMNKTDKNIYEQLHAWLYILILMHKYLEMEFLSNIVGICLPL